MESRQFRLLYREFLSRLIDLDVLAARGDPLRLFIQFAALLAAFSFMVALLTVPRYAFAKIPPPALALAATGDQQFLISTTMTVAGMFAVVAWDAIFPDRRDTLILRTLPIRGILILAAKLAAVATGLGVSIAAVNAFIGLAYPWLIGGVRTFAVYWLTIAACGAFVFLMLVAVQGAAALVLPYNRFRKISGLLQLGAFFLVLGGYFLTPGGSEASVTAPAAWHFLSRFPSYWFLGLFQQFNGSIHPVFDRLATQAIAAMSVVFPLAALAYFGAYFHLMRSIVEQPDIAPGDRASPRSRIGAWIVERLAPKPLTQAIVFFIARTLGRSRKHRLLMSIYLGVGLAVSLAYAKTMLYGGFNLYGPLARSISIPKWNEPNVPLMVAGYAMLFFAIFGVRMVFVLPVELKANWVFRATAMHRPESYFDAIRRAMYVLVALPAVGMAAAVYPTIWPARLAVLHLIIFILVAVILVERTLSRFRKMPFACSYLPGGGDLTRKLGAYGLLFFFVIDAGSRIELFTLDAPQRYMLLAGFLGWYAWRSAARRAEFAASGSPVLFEDRETAEIAPLELRPDDALSGGSFVDDAPPMARSPQSRLARAAGVVAILASVGAIYEGLGTWSDRRGRTPPGRMVDIGGRSLHVNCVGSGSPTVIFEAGGGGEGGALGAVERAVGKQTRVCGYDRAGAGWSDAGPYPRDAQASAKDLHALLGAHGVDPPYVLVGASLGGLIVRVYGGLYPSEVAGMVLVDASHVDERERISPPPRPLHWAVAMGAQVLRRLGVLRLLFDVEPRGYAEFAKVTFEESLRQARAAGHLGDRPIVVLTAGLPTRQGGSLAEARRALRRQREWIEAQAQLTRFSSRSAQIVVGNSRHCIACDAPNAVIDAVLQVVSDSRGK